VVVIVDDTFDHKLYSRVEGIAPQRQLGRLGGR